MHNPTFTLASRPALTAGLNAYRQVSVDSQVLGTDPHGLISLLFDGFLEALAQARGAMQAGQLDVKTKTLGRAMRILEEGLRGGLDFQAGGSLARDLDELYGYLSMRLTLANLRNDEAALLECQRLVQPLREAWLTIGKPGNASAGFARSRA